MGSLGEADGNRNSVGAVPSLGFSLADETQLFHSQRSPPSSSGDNVKSGGGDELLFEQCTQPIYDDSLVGDANETQVVDMIEETQVFEIDAETQLLDDPDCCVNFGTQVLDEFEDEVVLDSDSDRTDVTQVVSDTDELSDDETGRKGCIQSRGNEKIQQIRHLCENDKGSMEQSISLGSGRRSSESSRSFTSIRTAALRSSALASHNIDLKETKGDSGPILTEVQFSDKSTIHSNERNPEAGVDVNQNHDMGAYDGNLKEIKSRSNERTGCQAARKLFDEKSSAENGVFCAMDNEDAREYFLEVSSGIPYTSLSYMSSQEPTGLSQANALNFVDSFLNENLSEYEIEIDHRKRIGRKPKPVSGAKGIQNLAKTVATKYTSGETRIFDWDDSHEDEGGGDFFVRKKEELFSEGVQARKSSTELRNSKGRGQSKSSCERSNKDVKRMVNSDSKLMFRMSKEDGSTIQAAGISYKRNLFKEFHEQGMVNSSTTDKRDSPDMLDVGLDTQMAAEAMEALINGKEVENQNANDAHQDVRTNFKASLGVRTRSKLSSEQRTSVKRKFGSDDCTPMPSKRTNKHYHEEPLVLLRSKNVMECDAELQKQEKTSAKSNATEHKDITGGTKENEVPSNSAAQGKNDVALERSWPHESKSCRTRRSLGCSSRKEEKVLEVHPVIPVARRTRLSLLTNLVSADHIPADSGEGANHVAVVDSTDKEDNRRSLRRSRQPDGKGELSSLALNDIGEVKNVKLRQKDRADARDFSCGTLSCSRKRQSRYKSLVDISKSKPSILREDKGQPAYGLRSRGKARIISIDSSMRKARSSVCTSSILASVDANSEGKLSLRDVENQQQVVVALPCGSVVSSGSTCTNFVSSKALQHTERSPLSSTVNESVIASTNCDRTPKEKSGPSLPCYTPVDNVTPTKSISPICMGDEYFKQSCKKNLSQLSFTRELQSLNSMDHEPTSPLKDTRRRDLTQIRILFSQHLDDDIIKQQRKILACLGMFEVSSILDATHFITDKFVRTRNLLEAMASGKPIVTHYWLESIGQINTLVDEEAFILRDIKKEKEFGFCMPVSLAKARKHPLLQGRKVLITPNTKPGKDIISGLAKAVQGQVVERLGRSALCNDRVSDDLLILSCEVDYAICLPFLEKGASVYSSELLLNGIVTQKLEFDRYSLFSGNVRRTRSTIWLRKNDKFLPVRKGKDR